MVFNKKKLGTVHTCWLLVVDLCFAGIGIFIDFVVYLFDPFLVEVCTVSASSSVSSLFLGVFCLLPSCRLPQWSATAGCFALLHGLTQTKYFASQLPDTSMITVCVLARLLQTTFSFSSGDIFVRFHLKRWSRCSVDRRRAPGMRDLIASLWNLDWLCWRLISSVCWLDQDCVVHHSSWICRELATKEKHDPTQIFWTCRTLTKVVNVDGS